MDGIVSFIRLVIAIFSALYIFQTCVVEASEVNPKILHAVSKAADKYNFDPNLILAIIEVESNFNPKALGKAGEIGLMQLHPRYFSNIPHGIVGNIDMGVKYLAYTRKHCSHKNGIEFVTCYNRGTKRKLSAPKLTPYYRKVVKAYYKRFLAGAISL